MKKMDERNRKLIKNTTFLGIGTICTKGLMFIMTPFFIRWLTQEDYGLFDLLITYISLLIPITTCEIGQAAFRFLMKEEENKGKIISNSIFVFFIGEIISIILVIVISLFYNPIKNIVFSLIVCILAESFNLLLTMIARGKKKLNIYTISNIIYVISMVFFTYVFVYKLKMQLSGIILGYRNWIFNK